MKKFITIVIAIFITTLFIVNKSDGATILYTTGGGTGTSTHPTGYFLIGSSTNAITNSRDFTGTTTSEGNLYIKGNLEIDGVSLLTLVSSGNMSITGNLDVTGKSTLTYASTTAISSTGGAWFATAGGNVGIGTTGPGAKLHVVGADSAFISLVSGATKGVRFGANSTNGIIQGVDNTGVGSYQPLEVGGSDLRFTISGTEKVRVDTSGNVGIGTTGPTKPLDVVGTIRSSGNSDSIGQGGFALGSVAAGDYINLRRTTTGNNFALDMYNGSWINAITVLNTNGNVGIGTTTPYSKLHVTSGTSATTTSSFGTIGNSTSKACFNTKNTSGDDISFYFVGTAMVVENSLCK